MDASWGLFGRLSMPLGGSFDAAFVAPGASRGPLGASWGLKSLPTSRGIQIRIAFMVGVRHPVSLPELREERTIRPLHSQLKDVLELRVVGLVLSL